MTNDNLFDLLDFEDQLDSVEIKSQQEIGQDATFIVAELHYSDSTMTVPFVFHHGEDWILTPCDWQGLLPEDPEGIGSISWRVNNTDTEAIMFDGVPRLAPWTPDQKDINRMMRKRLGTQIRAAREAKGLSIRVLAEKAGVDKSQICRVEAGRYNSTIDSINSIASVLGLRLILE